MWDYIIIHSRALCKKILHDLGVSTVYHEFTLFFKVRMFRYEQVKTTPMKPSPYLYIFQVHLMFSIGPYIRSPILMKFITS